MLRLPALNAFVVQLALPPTKLTAVHIGVAPSLKSTVPVSDSNALTLAVKVTDWPKIEGLSEETIVVVVSALLMTRATLPPSLL
jgi:hypothetical protein